MSDCIVGDRLDAEGYARFGRGGMYARANGIVCFLSHGFPPTEQHQVAHSCNNRSCINGEHLRWATGKENLADRKQFGTDPVGERNGRAKLTNEQVNEIRELRGAMLQKDIAVKYGISQPQVSHIQLNRNGGAP